jgi:hypothetical protein
MLPHAACLPVMPCGRQKKTPASAAGALVIAADNVMSRARQGLPRFDPGKTAFLRVSRETMQNAS